MKSIFRQLFIVCFIKDDVIVIFQAILFFLCRDPGGKEIVPYLLPKRFRP